MSYIALYRKWRPLVFKDVVEQEHVVKTLRNSIGNGRIAHAYLFCGTRGTGKTTMAKIFSRAINCLNPNDGDPCNECEVCHAILDGSILDVVEIDAASNNSVDNVREIRDEVIYAPSKAKYKVYIIDEVHMLSTGAFNALLKTLEEPPSHVVFILATTEPHKLPATILSRCQRFDFRRISVESITERLDKIADASGVTVQKEAQRLIAKMADGALRDAISILDQCIALGNKEISYSDVLGVVGIVNDSFVAQIIDAIADKDIGKILGFVDSLVMEGKDIVQFVSDLVFYYRNLLVCSITDNPGDVIEASEEDIEEIKRQSAKHNRDELMYIIKELSALESSFKWAIHPRILLEVSLIKLCNTSVFNGNSSELMGRIEELENRLNNISTSQIKVEQNEIKKNSLSPENAGKKSVRKIEKDEALSAGIERGKAKRISNWGEILTELKKSGRMALYTGLMDAEAVELDNRFVGVIFGSGASFNKMLLAKAENLEVLESILSKKLGRDVKVKCVEDDVLSMSGEENVPEEKDELVEVANDIAKRLNVTLDVIDG